jgi:benzoate-CoA ligase
MTAVETPPAPSVTVLRDFNIAVEYIDGPAARCGDATAYIAGDERVSYTTLRERVNRVANALAGLGVEMEQRVAILLPNQPEFVTAFFGAARIGAVATPISYAVTADEQLFLLADSRARAFIVSAPLWAALRHRRAELPFLRHVLIVEGEPEAAGEHLSAPSAMPPRRSVTPRRRPATTSLSAAHLRSTGAPKWAMHLQRKCPSPSGSTPRPSPACGGDVLSPVAPASTPTRWG